MPKGIYLRTKPVWNKGKKGLQIAWNKNKPWSEKMRLKLSLSHKGQRAWNKGIPNTGFKQGYIPYNKGRKMPEISGKNHYNWAEDWSKLSYGGKHKRIKRELGKALKCTRCESVNDVEWSNITGEYKADITDWQALCNSCHKKYDGIANNLGKYAKKKALQIAS